jgi:hypothetical protein
MKNNKILIYKDILLRHNNDVVAAKKEKVYNNEDTIVRVPAKPRVRNLRFFLLRNHMLSLLLHFTTNIKFRFKQTARDGATCKISGM